MCVFSLEEITLTFFEKEKIKDLTLGKVVIFFKIKSFKFFAIKRNQEIKRFFFLRNQFK